MISPTKSSSGKRVARSRVFEEFLTHEEGVRGWKRWYMDADRRRIWYVRLEGQTDRQAGSSSTEEKAFVDDVWKMENVWDTLLKEFMSCSGWWMVNGGGHDEAVREQSIKLLHAIVSMYFGRVSVCLAGWHLMGLWGRFVVLKNAELEPICQEIIWLRWRGKRGIYISYIGNLSWEDHIVVSSAVAGYYGEQIRRKVIFKDIDTGY